MLVIGTFKNDSGIMQAVLTLENAGIRKDRMLVFVMDDRPNPDETIKEIKDPVAGHTSFEFGIAGATAISVIGISRGFVMAWGPIVWGMIGAACGFSIGFAVHWIYAKRRRLGLRKKKASELTVLVQCEESERKLVVSALWNNNALSIGLCPDKESSDAT